MKDIETSITISHDHKKKILDASRSLNVPVKVLLAVLMRKTRTLYRDTHASLWTAVKYQRRHGDFSIWHVSLDPLCYEFGVSQRLLFKFSVSRFFAAAIDTFLEIIVNEGINAKVSDDDKTTNYWDARYSVSYDNDFHFENWTIWWDKRLKTPHK